MIEVVGVQFKNLGKIYYFDPHGDQFKYGDHVIVETVRGLEYGKVVLGNKSVPSEEIQGELKKVIRKSTEEDDLIQLNNRNDAREAFIVCMEKINDHKLDMRLLSSEYTFDRTKLLFYFTAEGRVDFRFLVRDLASIFKTRIELRQVGVRDEAKVIGGLGPCGRETCCCNFLTEFSPVSIKMAKDQGLSLNPANISGTCGRLMCCLRYEQENYECMKKRAPRLGEIVRTDFGEGVVIDCYMIQELVKVRVEENDEVEVYTLELDDIERTRKMSRRRDYEDGDDH